MGIRATTRTGASSSEPLNDDRLRKRLSPLGLTPLADATARIRLSVCGEVKRIAVKPRSGSMALEIVIDDGTSDATVVFSGRPTIRGIGHGRCINIDGVAFEERGRLVFLNPAYTLLPTPDR